MKNQFTFSKMIWIIFLSSTAFISCKKEKMEPEVALRDQYLGSFRMEESCDTGDDLYTITITKSGDALEVFNLFAAGEISSARVYLDGTLNISRTYLGRSGDCPVSIYSASGHLQDNKLFINFRISTYDASFECFNNTPTICMIFCCTKCLVNVMEITSMFSFPYHHCCCYFYNKCLL